MNASELKKLLTPEDIANLVTKGLGSEDYLVDASGNLIFQTVCHNAPGEGKYKLYYYIDSQMFHCFTECSSSFDIFELVQKANKAGNFVQAFDYVSRFFGISHFEDDLEERPDELSFDWGLLEKYELLSSLEKEEPEKIEQKLPQNLLEYFNPLFPHIWYEEGISLDAMIKYNIRMYLNEEKIIIPHYNINGELIGIRGRSYNWEDLEEGKKYSPVFIEKFSCAHPLGEHLYGLNYNKESIALAKKAVIVEGEKSVLKAETFYPGNNFVVATCGNSISETQIDLLLKLGVNEIIIAFDKENDDFPGSEVSIKYLEKLKRIAQNFTPYVNVYLLYDTYNLLDHKDSPFDKGKETLEFLMKNKILVPSITVEENNKKRRRA